MTEWRALTLHAEWAYAVAYLGNRVENRTYPVPQKLLDCAMAPVRSGRRYRVDRSGVVPLQVMIHAGMDRALRRVYSTMPDRSRLTSRLPLDADRKVIGPSSFTSAPRIEMPVGCVVAVATITDCHDSLSCVKSTMKGSEHCSPWAQGGWLGATDGLIEDRYKPMWHWVLGDVRVLDTPVAAKGRQRLWIPDEETIAAVEGQIS